MNKNSYECAIYGTTDETLVRITNLVITLSSLLHVHLCLKDIAEQLREVQRCLVRVLQQRVRHIVLERRVGAALVAQVPNELAVSTCARVATHSTAARRIAWQSYGAS